MHELSIALSIVDICTEEARKVDAKSVSSVEVELGSLSGVEIQALEFCWEMAILDGPVAGASLIIRKIEAMARCNACGEEFVAENFINPCPKCNAYEYDLLGGRELKVKAITIE